MQPQAPAPITTTSNPSATAVIQYPAHSMGGQMDGRIASVERTLHWVPMVDRIRLEMERAGIHAWSELEVIRVTSESGVIGWGETIQNYTWGRADIDERVIGRSPFDLYWDDSLGRRPADGGA